MNISGIPDILQLCQNDFNKTLYGIEKFVKDVLNGRNSYKKRKISEKIHQLDQLCHFSKKRKAESEAEVTGNVPNEIWLKIIGYLKCKDVFLGFGQVCKHFNDLTHDPMAIKTLELNGINRHISGTAENDVLRILRQSKSLKRIVLESRHAQHDVFIEEALTSNPQLKSVTLFSSWSKVSCSKIVECLTKAKSIEHLQILNSHEGFDRSELLIKIADMKNLKTLRLNVMKEIEADFIKKISFSCSNLETIEISDYALEDPGIQMAFDNFFKKRKETLKSFILSQTINDDENSTILRNLSLCQNLEELSIEYHDCVLKQLPKIAKMCKIKRLMFTCGIKPGRFVHLIKFFKEARVPLLERLCIKVDTQSGENIEHVQLFSNASLKSFLEKSQSLKSIHLLGRNFEHDIWNISNQLLFKIIKDSNVFINFGKIRIGYDYKVGLVLSTKDKNHKRQLSLEQYLLDHDMSVFNKYQKMKDDFYIWFKETSNWHSFYCIDELYKEE